MKTQSQIFDFGRFADCLRRDITLNGKSWMLKALMMLGVTTLLLTIATSPFFSGPYSDYSDGQEGGAFLIFRFCGFVFCTLGASMFMENMTSNGLRLNSLMSPASDLEKYLSRITLCVVGVTVSFLICYTVADAIRVLYIRQFYGDLPGLSFIGPIAIQRCAESPYYLWGFMLAAQATFVLGSTVWPKNAFLKTFGTMIVLFIILIMLANGVFWLCHKPGHYWPSVPQFLETLAKTLPLCWTVFCYITAYYRFKESEIINRF